MVNTRYVLDMGESVGLPPKKDVMLALLEGPSVYVHLDPRRDGVVVPKWLGSQPQLVLQVGFNMAVRIPDLDVGDEGVSCTLSFNRSPFWCHLPWSAVYGIVGEDGRGMIWPDDVPAELSSGARQRPKIEPVREPTSTAEKEYPRAKAATSTKSSEHASSPSKSRRPSPRPEPLRAVPLPREDAPSLEPAREDTATTSDETRPAEQEARTGKRPLPPYLRVVK